MSIVRFATICDGCGTRGPEYQAYLHCRECLDDVCPACDVAPERDEERGATLCARCAELQAALETAVQG
jgi:hypothetical protein